MFAAIAHNALKVIHSSSISNQNKWAEKPKLKHRPTKWRTWAKIEASISASAHVWTLFVNNFSHGCQLLRKAWYCSFKFWIALCNHPTFSEITCMQCSSAVTYQLWIVTCELVSSILSSPTCELSVDFCQLMDASWYWRVCQLCFVGGYWWLSIASWLLRVNIGKLISLRADAGPGCWRVSKSILMREYLRVDIGEFGIVN